MFLPFLPNLSVKISNMHNSHIFLRLFIVLYLLLVKTPYPSALSYINIYIIHHAVYIFKHTYILLYSLLSINIFLNCIYTWYYLYLHISSSFYLYSAVYLYSLSLSLSISPYVCTCIRPTWSRLNNPAFIISSNAHP